MSKKELLVLTSEKVIPGGRLQEVIGLFVPYETEATVRRNALKTDKVVFREDHENICLHKTRSVLRNPEDENGKY